MIPKDSNQRWSTSQSIIIASAKKKKEEKKKKKNKLCFGIACWSDCV